jgi:hypothetical protein
MRAAGEKNGGHRRRGEAPRCPPVQARLAASTTRLLGGGRNQVRCAITNQSALKRFDDNAARIIQSPLRTYGASLKAGALQQKKGRRLNSAPACCTLPRVLYRYPATIPAKLPDTISRRLQTRFALPHYLLQSRHRGLHKGNETVCDGFYPHPQSRVSRVGGDADEEHDERVFGHRLTFVRLPYQFHSNAPPPPFCSRPRGGLRSGPPRLSSFADEQAAMNKQRI